MNSLKKIYLLLLIVTFTVSLTACKDASDYEKSGDFQKAYELHMKNVKKEGNNLSSPYDNKNNAIKDAADYAEACYRAADCKVKLGDNMAAQALYQKAAQRKYTITERYPVQQKVFVPAGYDDVWVPAGYKEVWIDGQYKEVWVDGGYKEVFIDGHYDSNNVYIDGHYEKVKEDGHYIKEYVGAHYEQEYVAGHNEKQWVEQHYEVKTHYETRPYSFVNNSSYVDMASSKLNRGTISNTIIPQNNESTNEVNIQNVNSVELKVAKDKLDTAYRIWVKSGSLTSGREYNNYMEAQKNYQNLKNN